jgi:N-acylglucosamine-6-phosphate 2-epimerase
MTTFEVLRHGLIVSCQPLPDEPRDPMRDTYVQARMALAASLAGAHGIRANGLADITAIREAVELPLIGLWKDGPGSLAANVIITPTTRHALAVANAGADIVAVDATARPRPGGETFEQIVTAVHRQTGALVLADVSTYQEALAAERAGADAVATTLSRIVGSPPATAGPDLELVVALAERLTVPVIAEGGYRTGEDVTRALDAGAHAVVVGNAATSPLWIIRRLVPVPAETEVLPVA